ncbi:MAG: hypothetical protein CLLPBCKN_000215 [Chroococcidiopsis cubana SAG 39.79]|jgi:hypothetical protein|nr:MULTISPECIES: hypothetical protein [Chroococcidiopsis]MDZ4870827.1 hypothetical protein [Chroococcidiopsis cubana SAG 39.79]
MPQVLQQMAADAIALDVLGISKVHFAAHSTADGASKATADDY